VGLKESLAKMAIGGAIGLCAGITEDCRRFVVTRKQDPNARFDWHLAGISWLSGFATGVTVGLFGGELLSNVKI